MLRTRRLSSRDKFYILHTKPTLRFQIISKQLFLHTVSTVHMYMLYNNP
jgi:hypothetical protein